MLLTHSLCVHVQVGEEWDGADGGSLDLFDADELGRPTRVTKRIVPQWNSFCMFAVSSVSHHQVCEAMLPHVRVD